MNNFTVTDIRKIIESMRDYELYELGEQLARSPTGRINLSRVYRRALEQNPGTPWVSDTGVFSLGRSRGMGSYD